MLDRRPEPERPADLGGDLPALVDRPVAEVPDQGLLLAVAQPGHGQDRAGIRGDDRPQVAVAREPQGHVILGFDILDPRGHRRHAVGRAHQGILHLRGQAGDGAAGDSRGRDRLAPVAGDLEDRPEPAAEDFDVRQEGQDSPDGPALAVVVQRLAGHRDGLGPVGGARGQREHQDLGPRAEQGAEVALAHAVDVRLVAVVRDDGDPAAEVGRGADLAEVMIAAELAVGMAGDPREQEIALDVGRPLRLVQEGAGQASCADLDRGADQAHEP